MITLSFAASPRYLSCLVFLACKPPWREAWPVPPCPWWVRLAFAGTSPHTTEHADRRPENNQLKLSVNLNILSLSKLIGLKTLF